MGVGSGLLGEGQARSFESVREFGDEARHRFRFSQSLINLHLVEECRSFPLNEVTSFEVDVLFLFCKTSFPLLKVPKLTVQLYEAETIGR
jgi:hypothetical protein